MITNSDTVYYFNSDNWRFTYALQVDLGLRVDGPSCLDRYAVR